MAVKRARKKVRGDKNDQWPGQNFCNVHHVQPIGTKTGEGNNQLNKWILLDRGGRSILLVAVGVNFVSGYECKIWKVVHGLPVWVWNVGNSADEPACLILLGKSNVLNQKENKWQNDVICISVCNQTRFVVKTKKSIIKFNASKKKKFKSSQIYLIYLSRIRVVESGPLIED